MTICDVCEREMTDAPTCVATWPQEEGTPPEPRVRYGEEVGRGRPGRARCGDCGTTVGGWHHAGCDLEQCRRCRRQLISCGCWWSEPLTNAFATAFADTFADTDEDDDEDGIW